MRVVLATCFAVGIGSAALSAQAPPQTPGAEHARMAVFEGQWTYKGEAKASPHDPARKAYTYHAITSHGDNIFVRGTTDGKVWTWVDETTVDGKPMKVQVTITEQSASAYGVRVEASMDNAPMMLIEEGTSTKQP